MITIDVTRYGVKSDSSRLQTKEIQEVIEECRRMGGGEILFPAGTYHIGTIRLYSHMTLHLLSGAKLVGSRDHRDYEDLHVPTTLGYVNDAHYIKLWHLPPYYIYGMICAFEAEDVSIVGEEGSLIDGQDCFDADGEEHFRGPMGIILCRCDRVKLVGYTFVDSANWSHQIDSCRQVEISRVTVRAGHDGFNLHHCRNIRIQDCHLETGDDCFAGYDVEDLEVRGCYANTACNSMRIGGRRLLFEDCVFEGPGHYPHISEKTFYTHAVFKYYAVRPDTCNADGEDILFLRCKISGAARLLSYDYQKEDLHQDVYPLRSLTFEDSKIWDMEGTGFFKGNGEHCHLTFRNVELGLKGEHPLMELDDSIRLTVDHVSCDKDFKILVGPDTSVQICQSPRAQIIR